jgi:tRNA G18 (ribose-2'-O)-methylase SpoU
MVGTIPFDGICVKTPPAGYRQSDVRLERIAGPDDDRAADYRLVADGDRLRERGLFVAEGRLVVRRLIEDGRWPVRSVLVSDAARASLDGVLELLPAATPVFVGSLDDFRGITGYHIHRGCLALGERAVARDAEAMLDAAHTVIVLEGVANADNVGAIFRNASALGADAVLLDEACADPLYRKAIRTSMGAALRVPFTRLAAWPDAIERLRRRDFTIVALTPRAPAENVIAFASRGRPERLAIVAGSEGEGLSDELARAADVRVRIPVRPEADSLNGIALHALQSRYTA